MKKILISSNDAKANTAKVNVVTFANELNFLIKDFVLRTEYQPKLIEVKAALRNNGEPLQKGLDEMVDKQIKGVFGSKLLKESLKTDTSKHVHAFVDKVHQLKLNGMPGYFELLTLENGLLILTDDGEETLRESFRKYLSTEQGKELHDMQISTANALNEYYEKIKGSTALWFVGFAQFANQFFTIDPESKKIVPRQDVDHEYLISLKETLPKPDLETAAA